MPTTSVADIRDLLTYLGGKLQLGKVRTVTGTYAMAAIDRAILANAAGGAFTVTLPPPAVLALIGPVAIKKIDAVQTAPVTVSPYSGLIDGVATLTLPFTGDHAVIDTDGTNYYVVGGNPVSVSRYAPTAGEESPDRRYLNNNVTLATGVMQLTYLAAARTESIDHAVLSSSGTAAGATPTLVRVGIYTKDSSGNLTLVASTPNDTSLLAATFTNYTKALSASFTKQAGLWYALGILVVTAAAAPTVPGMVTVSSVVYAEANNCPRIAGKVSSLSDLPSTVSAGSIAGNGSAPYVLLQP